MLAWLGLAAEMMLNINQSQHGPDDESKQQASANLERLTLEMEALNQEDSPPPPLLPIISYYGTGRLWDVGRLTQNKRGNDLVPNARIRGYHDCLSSSSHYKVFVDWFRRFSYEAKQEQETDSSVHNAVGMLKGIKRAVDCVLEPSGTSNLVWDFVEDIPVAHHILHGRLPVDNLSDGIRTMIGLVADIAHRAVRLNPHLGENAPPVTPGIVLIDEVDMHLHPEWQQHVIQSLQTAFPKIQFIVTTHSPQVLSTVKAESIRVIHCNNNEWFAETPTQQTRGDKSSDILAYLMGVDPTPPTEETQQLQRYRELIETGNAEQPEAVTLRQSLDTHFGRQHPLLLDCDRLIRFQAFKQRKKTEENKD